MFFALTLQSEELVCFRDIEPAAPHHYLVVPTEHIRDVLSLHRGHTGLGQFRHPPKPWPTAPSPAYHYIFFLYLICWSASKPPAAKLLISAAELSLHVCIFSALFSSLIPLSLSSLSLSLCSTVKRMAQMGEAVLRDQGITDMTNVR